MHEKSLEGNKISNESGRKSEKKILIILLRKIYIHLYVRFKSLEMEQKNKYCFLVNSSMKITEYYIP